MEKGRKRDGGSGGKKLTGRGGPHRSVGQLDKNEKKGGTLQTSGWLSRKERPVQRGTRGLSPSERGSEKIFSIKRRGRKEKNLSGMPEFHDD